MTDINANSPLQNTLLLIKTILPELKAVLSDISEGHGYFNLPTPIGDILAADGLPPWTNFYDDPRKIKSLATHAMLGTEKAKNFSTSLEGLTEQEKNTIRENYKKAAIDNNLDIFDFDDIGDVSEDVIVAGIRNIEEVDEDIRSSVQKRIYLLLYSVVTQMHYYLAIMTFGKSICALVKEAINGDDESFFKAVQIDRTVLFGIPYFQKRLIKAQLGSEPVFMQKLANAIKGRSLGQKLDYRELMLVFAVLDDEGYLDMPLEQLMDACQELGVYGREFGIEDIESLRKRRQYYRKKTGRQINF